MRPESDLRTTSWGPKVRVALTSDAHGNLPALVAVLASIERYGAELVLFAGDFVGYYYDGAEVVRALRSIDALCVRGNHDDMIASCESGEQSLSGITEKYGHGLELAIKQLNGEEKEWLAHLPIARRVTVGGREILLAHGSVRNNLEYIYPDTDQPLEQIGDSDFDIAVLGHTHYRMRREVQNCVIINPGSLGQPRDRLRGACWSLLDTETLQSEFHVEPYDHNMVADQARALDPERPYLWQVLDRA